MIGGSAGTGYIETTPAALIKLFVMYYLKTPDGVVQFIGVDRFVNFQAISAARRVPKFNELFPDDAFIRIEIAHVGNNIDCQNMMYKIVKVAGMPPLNIHGIGYTARTAVSSPIQCIETGVQYRTITECAIAIGAATSALSNHLNRKPGHLTVKGLTFKRI